MQTPLNVCKLYLLLSLGLSVNTSPILFNPQSTASNHQECVSCFQHGSSFSSNPSYANTEIKSHFQQALPVDQSLQSVPGVTTSFRDQNGNLVTQVKKEIINNENGQSSRAFEFKEDKQLPNGYSKSFKKEYSSSSVIGSQPTTFVQNPSSIVESYNNEKLTNGESSAFGLSSQNSQGSLISGNTNYVGFKPNIKFTVGQSMTNVPGTTLTYKDKYGNLITQVKSDSVNNEDGKNSHVFEFEETKQLPNGYSKSFKKEYSSSSVTGSQPLEVSQNPTNVEKYYNSEQQLHGVSSTQGQTLQNYQVPSLSSNTDYVGINTNSKSSVDQSLSNVPGVTSTFRDQYGNIVTQVKKEVVNNNNGQNSHAFEFEETKQLPNGYAKSFKKEYSSSSVTGSQPLELSQSPINVDKYYNSQQKLHEASSTFGQSLQNHQVPSLSSNTGYVGINTNSKSSVDQSLSNVPGVTSTFRDQYGNLVTQVKKEVVNNNNGQNSHAFEFEETKQLPNGYSKSFKKEYSSSSVINSNPTLVKDTTEKITSSPQKFTYGETEKLNSYNTFFNNQKYPLNSNGPINSQIIDSKKSTDAHSSNKVNSFGFNTNNLTDCDSDETGSSSSTLYQGYTQQNVNSNTKPSTTNQQLLNTNYLRTPKTPIGQELEKIESFSTQTREEVGQQSIDLYDFSKPSSIGQAPVNVGYQSKPKISNGQQLEKIESFSTQTREEVGQQSIDLHDFSKPSSVGQVSVNINYPSKPKAQTGQQLEKIESFSTQTREEVGQQSIDLHDFSKPSSVGQVSVNINYPSKPKAPLGQQLEKTESFSTLNKEEVGQQSIDLHDFSKPSTSGQVPMHISTQIHPTRQNFEKTEASSFQTEAIGQQTVDLHDFSNTSPIGQEPININNFYTPSNPTSQQYEKLQTSYQNKYDSVGKQLMSNIENGKSNSQYGINQQSISQPKTGQQIQGLEFLTSNYGDTTHVLDLGTIGQKPTSYSSFGHQNTNNGYQLASNKPFGQQTVGVFEKQSTIEKHVDLHDSDYLPANVNNYQENVNVNHQMLHGQSKKSPVLQGQQTVDLTSDFGKYTPTYQNQNYENEGIKKFEFSSNSGKLVSGSVDQPITTKYYSAIDKLGQLEHEIIGAKSTVNMNKDNIQTSYATNHNVKSMPVQTYQKQSHFSKTTNEDTQYIEPESEVVSGLNSEISSSSSFTKETKTIEQHDAHESHTLDNEHIFSEEPTTQSSVWKKFGDKFKGTIQSAKTKAQQIASTINEKVVG